MSSRGTAMTSTNAPLRQTVISTRRPMASSTIRRCSSVLEPSDVPATATTMSPALRPALSAGLPATTCATRRPSRRPSLFANAGGNGAWLPASPSQARRTRPAVIKALMMRSVVSLIGTARPTPIPATAVLTPTIASLLPDLRTRFATWHHDRPPSLRGWTAPAAGTPTGSGQPPTLLIFCRGRSLARPPASKCGV